MWNETLRSREELKAFPFFSVNCVCVACALQKARPCKTCSPLKRGAALGFGTRPPVLIGTGRIG